jgi:hypothetical protein
MLGFLPRQNSFRIGDPAIARKRDRRHTGRQSEAPSE